MADTMGEIVPKPWANQGTRLGSFLENFDEADRDGGGIRDRAEVAMGGCDGRLRFDVALDRQG